MNRSYRTPYGLACDLAERITFGAMRLEVSQECGRSFLRWVDDDATCNVSGESLQGWKGRKWRLSPHMTEMEVVNTAFLALLTAIEHEAREQFKVDGVAVMDSHRDLAEVIEFMRTGGGKGREYSDFVPFGARR